MTPEVRIKEISHDGRIELRLTNAIEFPEKFVELLNNSKDQGRQMNDQQERLIDLCVISQDTYEHSENLVSWEVISASETSIIIDLKFDKPLLVS